MTLAELTEDIRERANRAALHGMEDPDGVVHHSAVAELLTDIADELGKHSETYRVAEWQGFANRCNDERIKLANQYAELKATADALTAQLANALNWLMCNNTDDFTNDGGRECPPHRGGDYGGWCENYNYGEVRFSWREALAALRAAGGDVLKYHETTRNNRAFLQQFATREGTEKVLARLREGLAREMSGAKMHVRKGKGVSHGLPR